MKGADAGWRAHVGAETKMPKYGARGSWAKSRSAWRTVKPAEAVSFWTPSLQRRWTA